MNYGIYKCPNCDNFLIESRILCGTPILNSARRRPYSDFRVISPAIKTEFRLIKCPSCNNLLWSDKYEYIMSALKTDWDNFKKEEKKKMFLNRLKNILTLGKIKIEPIKNILAEMDIEEIKNIPELDIYDFIKILKSELYRNKKEEKYIRRQIWLNFNYRLDRGEKIFKKNDDESIWRDNMNKLLDLLNKNDLAERFLMAEICRNLGRFDEAINTLKDMTIEDLIKLKKEPFKRMFADSYLDIRKNIIDFSKKKINKRFYLEKNT